MENLTIKVISSFAFVFFVAMALYLHRDHQKAKKEYQKILNDVSELKKINKSTKYKNE